MNADLIIISDNYLWAVERSSAIRDRPGIGGLSPFEPNFFVSVVAERLFVELTARTESIVTAGTELLSSHPAQSLSKLGHLL